MRRDLTIAAFLSVKDEVELIEHSIRHLRAIGVDYIVVCEMSSTDGTLEILERYRADDLSILSLSNASLDPRTDDDQQWEAQARHWYAIAPCDWVIFVDADEFWLPATGNLKDCAAFYSSDVLTVERYNVALGPNGPFMPLDPSREVYDQIYLYARTIPSFHVAKQTHAKRAPWIHGMAEPKIAARRSKIIDLALGQHDVVVDPSCRRERPDDLVIAHLGLSTLTRFKRKVANIRTIYADSGIDLSLPDQSWEKYGTAWHWRRWAALGDLSTEFGDNAISDEELGILRRNGEVMSARELLSRRVPRLGDAYLLRGRTLSLELEYESMFRPSEEFSSRDERLLAVRFQAFGFACAETGDDLGRFDFLAEHPDGWHELFGFSHFEDKGRWSLGPRSAVVFSLRTPAPGKVRMEISHSISQLFLSRVSARLRVNGGAWRRVVFEGGACVVDIDLGEGSRSGSGQNLSLVPHSAPSVSILMMNRDQPELTFAAVLAIEAAGIRRPYDIILVDNGSVPLQAGRLAEMALPVRLIQTPHEMSFGTANNLAAEAARGEFLLLLNSDAFLSEGVVDRLAEEFSDQSVGLAGPVFRFPNGSLQETGRFVSVEGSTATAIFNGLGWDVPEAADVDYISAACVMLRRTDFLGIGGFDPEFELAYSEDVDLCLRLRAAGKRSRLVTSVSVRHISGATALHYADKARLEAMKRRNLNVLRSRLGGFAAATRGVTPAPARFDLGQLEQQIARFPDEDVLHCVLWEGRLTSGSHAGAMLAHASALSRLRPTMVASRVGHALLDVCDRASALGLACQTLTTGGRAELERRDFDVTLVSSATFPPAATPSRGVRRILHCPVPTLPDEADLSTLRRRIGNLVNFDAVVTDSEFSRRACAALLDRLGAPQVSIEVVSGPVDVFASEECAWARDNIIVSFGPLRRGPSGGAHEVALRAFRTFSAAQPARRWRMVIVGALPVEADPNHVDVLRRRNPQLDVDVLVDPPRAVLRRLLARTKIYLSARGHDAESTEDPAAFSHSITQIASAVSAGCVPVAFHIGAEAEFLEAHAVGYVFRNKDELATRLLEAALLADAGGLTAEQRGKMENLGAVAHAKAWARVTSSLRGQEERKTTTPALVVAGCHRSGTSAMARTLSLAGADLPSDLMPAAPDNPSGLWEPAAVAALNEAILVSRGSRWDDPYAFSRRRLDGSDAIREACQLLDANYPGNRPIVLKDPRISILANLWDAALRAAQYQPKYIIMLRDPREVAASLSERNRFSMGKSLLLWATYMLAIEQDTRSAERVFVTYEDLLSHPMATLDQISTELRVDLACGPDTEPHVRAYLTPERRRRPTVAPFTVGWTEAIEDYFQALRAASRGEPLTSEPGEKLQAWLTEFAALFGPESLEA